MAWEDRSYYREGASSGRGPKFIFQMPSMLTFAIIIANVVVFLFQAFPASARLIARYAPLTFINSAAVTQPWRWITYQYVHAGAGHLFFNLIAIYFFLPMIENVWGWKRAFAFYTLGGIAAGAAFGVISIFYPGIIVGASGSIMAVLGAATAIAPDMQVLAQMIIPMTMRTMALLYTVFYVFSIVGDRNPSDAAHLGGLAFGYLAVRFGRGSWDRLSSRFSQDRTRRKVEEAADEQQTVDRILQKVSDHGMNSLTKSERKALKIATERQRQRDMETARSRS